MNTIDLNVIQKELAEWQRANFPPCTPEQMVCGVVEEFGEYNIAITPEEMVDALADAAIYTLQLATLYGIPATDVENTTSVKGLPNQIVVLGNLSHAVLKSSQNIRGQGREQVLEAMRTVWAKLKNFYNMDLTGELEENISFGASVVKVATEVMKRDWTKNPTGEGY